MSHKRVLILGLLVVTVLAFASSAMADGAPVTIVFNGGYAFASGGYGIPPYQGTMNGVSEQFFCVDFKHDIVAGQSWKATVTSLTNATGVAQNTYLGSQTEYLEFAWLIGLMMSAEKAKDWTDAAAYQAMIWSFTGGPAAAIPTADWYPSWFTGQGWEILTPTVVGSGQEFLVQTPEPSILLLFGTGLVLIGVILKKRSAQNRAY